MAIPDSESFATAWQGALPRPPADASRESKKNFAERFSRCLTEQLCTDLAALLGDDVMTAATANRTTAERSTVGLNVVLGNAVKGLGLGVSLKTITFHDVQTGRYTKNYKRIDQELTSEAMEHHERQPYAVLVALLFMPVESANDGGESSPSSFGAAVQRFRVRIGRVHPHDSPSRFERMYIGLYEVAGSAPKIGFFDASQPPPRRGVPELLNWSQMLDGLVAAYADRNPATAFRWLDESGGVG